MAKVTSHFITGAGFGCELQAPAEHNIGNRSVSAS